MYISQAAMEAKLSAARGQPPLWYTMIVEFIGPAANIMDPLQDQIEACVNDEA